MPKIWDRTRLQPSDRLIARIQSRGTRGDVAKTLAELIKNCDDTYGRAEDADQAKSGEIIIGYWRRIRDRKKMITGFFVRDYGQGMDESRLRKGYHIYGESEPGINSKLGVGGKDALKDYDDCYIFTVRNGRPLVARINTDPHSKVLQSEAWSDAEALKFFEIFNKRIAHLERVNPLSPDCDGTTIAFGIPQDMKTPRLDKLYQRLRSFYTLRRILQKGNRRAYMVDIETGEESRLHYKHPEEETSLESVQIKVQLEDKEYLICGRIGRSRKELDKNRDTGENLLIMSEKGAVLDNTLLGLEERPGAARLFGELVVSDWDELYETDPTVLTDNREGLDWNNVFNRKLRIRLLSVLLRLISQEENKTTTLTSLDERLHKRVRDALARVNAEMKKEARGELTNGDEDARPLPEVFRFMPAETEVILGQDRRIYLQLNPSKVLEGGQIELEANNQAVIVDPYPIVTAPPNYTTDLPSCSIVLTGNEPDGQTTLTARYREFKTRMRATVIAEPEVIGMVFKPATRRYHPGRVGRLKLIINTEHIPEGSEVSVASSNPSIHVKYDKFLVGTPNMSVSLREDFVEVYGGKVGDRAEIDARGRGLGRIEHTASAIVKVVKKVEPKSFFNDIDFDHEHTQGRYHFDRYEEGSFTGNGVIWIHTHCPVLEQYFGRGLERLNQIQNPQAQILLAETISQCICEIWAKYRLDNGLEISADPSDYDEIRRISNRIDAEHGSNIYRNILGKIREETRSMEE